MQPDIEVSYTKKDNENKSRVINQLFKVIKLDENFNFTKQVFCDRRPINLEKGLDTLFASDR
jgi:hypothetical protein